jgi:hypothetical protein
MKRTAVEWLVNMWEMQGTITPLDIREAKRIEKEQMIDAHFEGQNDETDGCSLDISEQYYNETFKTNEK